MHEIIVIQVGQCGNKIGSKFWEYIAHEHGVTPEGKLTKRARGNEGSLDVYFHQTVGGAKRFVPRAVLVDLEPNVLDSIQNGANGSIYRPDNFVRGQTGGSNNFGKGFNTYGPTIIREIMEVLRNELEICDYAQGIQMTHSVGGGTGSGLGSLILDEASKQCAEKAVVPFTVFPSPKISDVVVEPYNSILALQHLVDECEFDICLDNEALYSICQNELKIQAPSYADMNHVISAAMGGITASLRFPGSLNASLRKICTNMVHSPRLHFFLCSYAPLNSRKRGKYASSTVSKLTMQIFDARNFMCAVNPGEGKYFTTGILFRGDASLQEIDENMQAVQYADESHFIKWIPNNIQRAICTHPAKDERLSATMLANSSAITQKFTALVEDFRKMYDGEAFLYAFKEEGVEPEHFDFALETAGDLSATYEGMVVIGDDDFA